MGIGTTFLRRAGVVSLVGLMACIQGAGAQDSTQYSPPDDINSLSGSISTDGSSTVGPMTAAVAEEFLEIAPEVRITVDFSGTGGGFKRFCTGDTDISNASRAIEDDEIAACAEGGFDYYQFEVAYDGITVVVNSENNFVSCLTVDQLNQLWAPDSDVTTWSQLNPDWPDEAINLYGPGADSGTFDYFTGEINGEEGASRTDFQPSEDDNVIVQGVANDTYALGYFGFAYFVENQDLLKAVQIDSGDGCVAPSEESIGDGSYAPLSRPLYIYVRADALQRGGVQEFTRFYLANASSLARDVGYIGLPAELVESQQDKLEGALGGTVAPDSDVGSATPVA